MQTDRYPYSAIIRRPPLRWPNEARVALCVIPNIECFHIDQPLGRESPHVPDVQNYSLRDYGPRVGVFRIMDVLDKYRIRASAVLNADVCGAYPAIIEEGQKRRWEWLGHGVTNHVRLSDYSQEQEQNVIRQVKQTITAAVGKAPRGWLSPGLAETLATPDHLAAEGFEYVCDWGSDDQPFPMRVRQGRMLALPVHSTISDIVMFLRANRMPDDYTTILRRQFDTLYREGAESGRMMAVPLHPFIIGLPFRIDALDKALEYICSHDRVWLATGGEILDWYYEYYSEA